MTNGRSELARRFAELDGRPFGRPDVAMTAVIRVMSRITSTDDRAAPRVSPEEADGLARRSCLLTQLAEVAPEIVVGPLRLDAQYWVGTDKPRGDPTPTESAFIHVSDATTKDPSTKPFRHGFFTATGVLGTHGMWRLYLDDYRGSTLYPQPWHTWAVESLGHPIVHEITTAAEWVEFVLAHPRRHEELLFPDWLSVARHYDAIHMTLRAIAAIQGLSFPTEQGIVAPTYWDVESTFWLRWCFGAARLVEVVNAEESISSSASAQLRGLHLEYPPEPRVAWIEATLPDDDPAGPG